MERNLTEDSMSPVLRQRTAYTLDAHRRIRTLGDRAAPTVPSLATYWWVRNPCGWYYPNGDIRPSVGLLLDTKETYGTTRPVPLPIKDVFA